MLIFTVFFAQLFFTALVSYRTTTAVMGPPRPLPRLSAAVSTGAFNYGSSFISVWEHGISLQPISAQVETPKTVLVPADEMMVNLVPQDVSHPLYDDGPKYTALRHSFLLDYLIEQEVTPDNPAMATSQGLTVTNMNGNNIVFKKDSTGSLHANGLSITKEVILPDRTRLYVLDGLLFNHEAEVREAFDQLMEEQPEVPFDCPFGSC